MRYSFCFVLFTYAGGFKDITEKRKHKYRETENATRIVSMTIVTYNSDTL